MEKENERRKFLKTGILSALGGAAAATFADSGKYLPISEGRELNKLLSELQSKFLNPGVTVSAGTSVSMAEDGYKTAFPKSEVNIELSSGTEQDEAIKKIVDSIKNVEDVDKENVYLLATSIAGPYTAIAVVGSVANQKSDKAVSDIDILVLNGNDEVYPARGHAFPFIKHPNKTLFDNQRTALRNNFRPVHFGEIIKHIQQYDPEKADKMSDAIRDKHMFYGPLLTDEFMKRNEVNMNDAKENSRLLHLLGPSNEKEGAAYNVKTLNNALQKGEAIMLYQGKNNKLIQQ